MTNEQLRMQMLAGVITEGEYKEKLEENKFLNFFKKKEDSTISIFKKERDKLINNVNNDEKLSDEEKSKSIKDIKDAFMAQVRQYDMLENKKSLNENFVGMGAINSPFAKREKEVYEDAFEHFLSERYVSEVNELNEEDSMGKVGEPGGFMGFAQHLKDKGINIEKEETNTIPLDATTKRYVIKRLKEILDEYDEEGIEELQNAGFFEQDFEEELVVEFGGDYDSVNVSPELSDFISNLAY